MARPDCRRARPSRLAPAFGAYRLVTAANVLERWNNDLPSGNPGLFREDGIAELVFETLAALDPRSQFQTPRAFRCPNGALADLVRVFNGRPLYDPAKLTMPVLLIRGGQDTTSTATDAQLAQMDKNFRLTRPEWIVLFCLTQQPRLNSPQISIVTGRPKTSIAGAVKQLQRKKLITRRTDIADSRRRVLHLTDAGRSLYKSILGGFVAREADMLAGLDLRERRELIRLFDRMIKSARSWATPY